MTTLKSSPQHTLLVCNTGGFAILGFRAALKMIAYRIIEILLSEIKLQIDVQLRRK